MKIIESTELEPAFCYECGNFCDAVVEVGEEMDHQSMTTDICKDCLQKALGLIEPNL